MTDQISIPLALRTHALSAQAAASAINRALGLASPAAALLRAARDADSAIAEMQAVRDGCYELLGVEALPARRKAIK